MHDGSKEGREFHVAADRLAHQQLHTLVMQLAEQVSKLQRDLDVQRKAEIETNDELAQAVADIRKTVEEEREPTGESEGNSNDEDQDAA